MNSSIRSTEFSTSSLSQVFSRSVSSSPKKKLDHRKHKYGNENIAPIDPNVQCDPSSTPTMSKKNSILDISKERSAIPSDPAVKIVARIRPVHGRETGRIVKKNSCNSLSLEDRTFTFNAVFDSQSTQEDLFQSVGVPLVKNSLAGFNTSILSCGQTGSGKTYTMWGPPSAMIEAHCPTNHRGIVPRIFELLFDEIQKAKDKSEDKQRNYQCRCSFLEIYNEQISDLLDPTQRNLQIRDDSKSGFYVENLTEEYVNSSDEISHLLIKGLSNRKVGTTSVNSKSSRSHIVFTCVVESWCKGSSSKCFSSSMTSRISLIDLAGSERNKLEDIRKESKVEDKCVKRSLHKLGKLVKILSNSDQPLKQEEIPYRDSCLTHLLRDSLGGNAKLTVICSICPDNRCKGETLSTLRFAERLGTIKNNPEVNELTENDVNVLSDQIRQLKEELIRVKSNSDYSMGCDNNYLKRTYVRDSLNVLRLSLNRSLILPHVDNDSEDEIEVNEEDVKGLCVQLNSLCDDNSCDNETKNLVNEFDSFNNSYDSDQTHCEIPSERIQMVSDEEKDFLEIPSFEDKPVDSITSMNNSSKAKLSIMMPPCMQVLQDPPLSSSPKIDNRSRERTDSSCFSGSKNYECESPKPKSEVLRRSLKRMNPVRSSLQSNNLTSSPTESLAASLHRGLQIIDQHQRHLSSMKSTSSFSFENLVLRPDTSQKVPSSVKEDVLCVSCKNKLNINGCDEVKNSIDFWIVPVHDEKDAQNPNSKEEESLRARKREKELETLCSEQAAKIEQLNHLMEQCEHNHKQNLSLSSANRLDVLEENSEFYHIRTELEKKYKNFDISEREMFLKEIQNLRKEIQIYMDGSNCQSLPPLLQLAHGTKSLSANNDEIERERQKWTEMESKWISLTEELRLDLQSCRQMVEKRESELRSEKMCSEELGDALQRSILGHGKMIEHYADLQDNYNELVEKNRRIMDGVAEVKKAVAKAGLKKGGGRKFVETLNSELSALQTEREKERNYLKKENKSLKKQLRDTAEAVQAAGELLVRLREAEEAVALAEDNFVREQDEKEKLKKQVEKLKKKHTMEMDTMKQYLAESRLPETALKPIYEKNFDREESVYAAAQHTATNDPDWRSAFSPAYNDPDSHW